MNYREVIQKKLDEIEEKEQVKILHAVESGSRSWGFASPDSDYDVRFIYIRDLKYYLGLQKKKDFISWELNETLDISGWDVSKVLSYLYKSNATVFEWSNSPVIYRTTETWEFVKALMKDYFSCKSCMYHYYGTAQKNYKAYLQEEQVKYKKYFYVLRPLLCCQWIEERKSPPPMLFSKLLEAVLGEEMKPVVYRLLEQKTQMLESEKGARIEALQVYIEQKLTYYQKLVSSMKDDRNPDWSQLNQLFYRLLTEKNQ